MESLEFQEHHRGDINLVLFQAVDGHEHQQETKLVRRWFIHLRDWRPNQRRVHRASHTKIHVGLNGLFVRT